MMPPSLNESNSTLISMHFSAFPYGARRRTPRKNRTRRGVRPMQSSGWSVEPLPRRGPACFAAPRRLGFGRTCRVHRRAHTRERKIPRRIFVHRRIAAAQHRHRQHPRQLLHGEPPCRRDTALLRFTGPRAATGGSPVILRRWRRSACEWRRCDCVTGMQSFVSRSRVIGVVHRRRVHAAQKQTPPEGGACFVRGEWKPGRGCRTIADPARSSYRACASRDRRRDGDGLSCCCRSA